MKKIHGRDLAIMNDPRIPAGIQSIGKRQSDAGGVIVLCDEALQLMIQNVLHDVSFHGGSIFAPGCNRMMIWNRFNVIYLLAHNDRNVN